MTMKWGQKFPSAQHNEVHVAIVVTGWSDDANKQLSTFVRDLVSRGVTISGKDVQGARVFTMEAS